MIDDDFALLFRRENRKARKSHRCTECARVIDPGEQYVFEVTKMDDISQHKTCVHCQALREWLAEECSGWIYNFVLEDFQEHLEYFEKSIPRYRLEANMWRGWRTRNGDLVPVPVLFEMKYGV